MSDLEISLEGAYSLAGRWICSRYKRHLLSTYSSCQAPALECVIQFAKIADKEPEAQRSQVV